MTLLLSRSAYPGADAKLVRKAAGELCRLGSARPTDLSIVLGAHLSLVEPLWQQLVAEDRIAADANGHWRPTPAMHLLASARIGKALSRDKVPALLKQLVERADAANARPVTDDHYYVTRMAVFGSYLDERKKELGDLDIAWALERRPSTVEHFVHCIMYGMDPISSTRALVRPKGPYVRLIEYGQLLEMKCPYRDIYAFEPPLVNKVAYDQAAALIRSRYRILRGLDFWVTRQRGYNVKRVGSMDHTETDHWTADCRLLRRGEPEAIRATLNVHFQPGSDAVLRADVTAQDIEVFELPRPEARAAR